MREKSLKCIVTFHTTTEAMAFEGFCLRENIPGRLIPVPGEISAGCGLSWCAEDKYANMIEAMIKNRKIEYDKICRILH